ncbi:hypothetical protein HZA55_05045 [Candidatus Poribacteria bacterium]|nr:hypothetical protein [Candidatus Poribacteria bacterium]
MVKTQADAYTNTTTLSKTDTSTVVAGPDGTAQIFQFAGSNGAPSLITDAENKQANFTSSARGKITLIKDRMGATTSMTYHEQTGKIASITNSEGNTITNTYTEQDQTFTNPDNRETVIFTFYNLTRVDYPDGTNEQFTYDASVSLS